MDLSSKQDAMVLAEKNSWSLAYAEGYIVGEACRKRGEHLAKHVLVGIDEYCRGIRAGYFPRRNAELPRPPGTSMSIVLT